MARTLVIAAWQEAGRALGVEVEAPFRLQIEERTHDCVAYLRDFGGPRGAVLTTWIRHSKRQEGDAERSDGVIRDCARLGYYHSSIDLRTYARFDRETFIEALRDWGYFGAESQAPRWLGSAARFAGP